MENAGAFYRVLCNDSQPIVSPARDNRACRNRRHSGMNAEPALRADDSAERPRDPKRRSRKRRNRRSTGFAPRAPRSAARFSARSRWSRRRWSPCCPAAMRCSSARRASPRRCWSRRSARVLGLDAKRVQFTPDLMPADILGSEVLEESPTAAAPSASSPGRCSPVADGRRDQPRQPAHPVGAAAGDAGISRHHRRRALRPAAALPCAGDAEPDGAGGHLSAAGGPARPLSDADRRALSRSRGGTAHADRDHRRARAQRRSA